MSTLTVRLTDDTHERLKELARHRGASVNKLMEELSTIAVAQHDAETRPEVATAFTGRPSRLARYRRGTVVSRAYERQ